MLKVHLKTLNCIIIKLLNEVLKVRVIDIIKGYPIKSYKVF